MAKDSKATGAKSRVYDPDFKVKFYTSVSDALEPETVFASVDSPVRLDVELAKSVCKALGCACLRCVKGRKAIFKAAL